MTLLLIFIIALFVSSVSAVIGIGGGLVLVPALVTIACLPPSHAAGTALASITIFALTASYKNYQNRFIIKEIVFITAGGSIIGAIIGARLSLSVPFYLWKILFLLIAVYIAYNMLATQKGQNSIFQMLNRLINILPVKYDGENCSQVISLSGFALLGILVGIISSLFGVGGGFITTPFFMLGMGVSAKKAVASSLSIIAVTSFAGSLSHLYLGNFDLHLWLVSTSGMAIGGYTGSLILKKIPENYIKYIFTAAIFCSVMLILAK